jgi:hypothetical protein
MTAPPWTTLWVAVRGLLESPNPILVLNFMSVVSICVLSMVSRPRLEYLLYAAAAIAILLCKETKPPMQSMMRYVLIIFPAYIGLAQRLQSPRMRSRFSLVCAALFIINIGLLWLFLGWSLVL